MSADEQGSDILPGDDMPHVDERTEPVDESRMTAMDRLALPVRYSVPLQPSSIRNARNRDRVIE